ncbi:hypothetical protein [Rhizobium herbae]
MSDTTDFIAELIRAANEVGKLGAYEKRRLLERAVATISEGRNRVGIPPSKTAADAVIDLQTLAASIDSSSDDEAKAGLLDAVDMIRTIKIVRDGEDELTGNK